MHAKYVYCKSSQTWLYRYLVVIDDVWTAEAWQYIQYALPKNALTSRIIMTTRINSVGQLCRTSDEGFLYQMKPLGISSGGSRNGSRGGLNNIG